VDWDGLCTGLDGIGLCTRVNRSRPWSGQDRGPECTMDQNGPWTILDYELKWTELWTGVDQNGPLTRVDRQPEWSVNKMDSNMYWTGLWTGVDHGLDHLRIRLECIVYCGVDFAVDCRTL